MQLFPRRAKAGRVGPIRPTPFSAANERRLSIESTLSHKHRTSGDDPSISRFLFRAPRETAPPDSWRRLSIYAKLIRRRFVRLGGVINLAGRAVRRLIRKSSDARPQWKRQHLIPRALASRPEVHSTRKTHSHPLFPWCCYLRECAAEQVRKRVRRKVTYPRATR